jgi:glyoxylase-like metal-dependent hydrolase (beta-lactamase superfamily II)
VHPRGSQHIVDPRRLEAGARTLFGDKVNEYGAIKGVDIKSLIESNNGEELEIGDVLLKVIWTPGHSSHHQVYFEPNERVLFIGDAAGRVYGKNGGVIPTSPMPHNPVNALESIEKLINLNPLIIAYSHFGFFEDATLRLKEFKKQTLTWKTITDECVEEGVELSDTLEILREVDINVEIILNYGLEIESNLFQSLEGFVEYAKWNRNK